MVLRNGISFGYPFRESILSALPVVDEMLVGVDPLSEDGTLPAVELLARMYPKIRVSEVGWSPHSTNGSAMRDALITVKEQCRGDYVFEVDANEIIPPEDVPFLRNLPRRFPSKELFGLPYIQLLGVHEFTSEVRYRFAKNSPSIRPVYDSWTMDYAFRPIDLIHAKEVKRMVSRLALRLLRDRIAIDMPEQDVVLPSPIHKYYGLFPEPFVAKLRSKAFHQDNQEYITMADRADELRHRRDWMGFWNGVYELHQQYHTWKTFDYWYERPPETHPSCIRNLIGKERYE